MRFAWIAAALLAASVHAGPPEWVAAKVVKVDAQRSRVTLDHARIKSIDMEPMVMPFKVEPTLDLSRFKPGDRVRFSIALKDEHLVVQAMEKRK